MRDNVKEILAVIRTECTEVTKQALEETGVRGITFMNAIGRGRQNGVIRLPDPDATVRRALGLYLMEQRRLIAEPVDHEALAPVQKELNLGFLPRKLLMMVVEDGEVAAVVGAIMRVNQQGAQGDGRIFICPVLDAVRIRTGEQGSLALA